jgi:hypothetical protein
MMMRDGDVIDSIEPGPHSIVNRGRINEQPLRVTHDVGCGAARRCSSGYFKRDAFDSHE